MVPAVQYDSSVVMGMLDDARALGTEDLFRLIGYHCAQAERGSLAEGPLMTELEWADANIFYGLRDIVSERITAAAKACVERARIADELAKGGQ